MWWNDWAGDNALSLCSLAAQGLWMRLLCIAAQNEPFGSILISGRQPSDEELASLIKPAIKVARFRKLLAELERRNVVKRKPNGVLFSSRMEADWKLNGLQSDKGLASWKSRKNKGVSTPAVQTEAPIRFKPEDRRKKNQLPSIKGGVVDSSGDADERVVRLNGARAHQPRHTEEEYRHPAARLPGETDADYLPRLMAM